MTEPDAKLLESIAITVVRIEERQKAHDAIHVEEEKVRAAESQALTKQLDALNDVRTRFLPRGEYAAEHDALAGRVGILENFRSKAVGVGTAMVAGAGLLGGAIGRIWR